MTLFIKGQFVHYLGWGLAKIHDVCFDYSGNVFYMVNTRVISKQVFQFGIMKAHSYELKFLDDVSIKKEIESITERNNEVLRNWHKLMKQWNN